MVVIIETFEFNGPEMASQVSGKLVVGNYPLTRGFHHQHPKNLAGPEIYGHWKFLGSFLAAETESKLLWDDMGSMIQSLWTQPRNSRIPVGPMLGMAFHWKLGKLQAIHVHLDQLHLFTIPQPWRSARSATHEVPAWVEDLRVASPGASADPTKRLGEVFNPQKRVFL